jgi:hypothetical protein
MRELTKEYVLKVVEDGIARHGTQADYERAVGLNKQAIKDIRRAKKCPPADIWQKIAREAGLDSPAPEHDQIPDLHRIAQEISLANEAVIERIVRMEKRLLDAFYYGKNKRDNLG